MIALFSTLLATAALAGAPAPQALTPAAHAWWRDIEVLAADDMQGRQTGSLGYLRAADYVESRFKAEGLTPAGENGGYRQSVAFVQQIVAQDASLAVLLGPGGERDPLTARQDIIVSSGGGPRPSTVTAPLVFIGYGLHLPKSGYDDFAGLDLKGKIAVVISGGPADIPGPVKAAARFERASLLARAGAVGLITLVTPQQVEIPWARQKLLSEQPGMYLADAALRDTPDGFLLATINPDSAERLFVGSGHAFAELSAVADASGRAPTFDLARKLSIKIVASLSPLASPNLVAKLEGSDPKLKTQFVAVSAHLDHLGVGAPINGDPIYHGAMDDASGVASVLDIAHRLRAGPRPRRSVLFLIVTAEEKGLLGSHYFAVRPTTGAGTVVADLNFDMPLPLWPLKSVTVQGADESTLGADARAIAASSGLTVAPDPLPDRNSFIRTDQFSFVRQGVPSLAFKFGFAKGTPEFDIEHAWRANRYHAPSDDLKQPGVFKEEAVKLDAYVAALVTRVANEETRPSWLATSVFRPDGASK